MYLGRRLLQLAKKHPDVRISLSLGAVAVLVAALAGCSATVTPSDATSASASPTAYAIPSAPCPTEKDISADYASNKVPLQSVDLNLVSTQLSTALPPGGCAFVDTRGRAAAGGSAQQYNTLHVFYFNLDKSAVTALTAWGQAVGGVEAVNYTDKNGLPCEDQACRNTGKSVVDPNGLDLPGSLTGGWSGNGLSTFLNESSCQFCDPKHISRGYLQPNLSSGHVTLTFNAEIVKSIESSSGSSAPADPTKLLSAGLSTTFATALQVTSTDGYAVGITVKGTLSPFTKDIAKEPPGKFDAVYTSAASGTVTNTTAGRNTKTPSVGVVALYPANSTACNGYQGVSKKGADWSNSSYCAIQLGFLEGVALTPAASQSVGKSEPSGQTVRKVFAEGTDALSQLNNPTSIYAYTGGKGSGLTNVDWQASTGCLSQSEFGGQWWVVMAGWPDVICQ